MGYVDFFTFKESPFRDALRPAPSMIRENAARRTVLPVDTG
jgi:hypothetical protein